MSRSRRAYAVAAVYLGTFMATLAISIVAVALPAIEGGLHVGLAGLQWVVGSLTLCMSAFMLSAGAVGDRYGRKRTWLGGVALFTIGSAVCASASSLAQLIAGCALQGIAGALVIPGALSIITKAYSDPTERAHVIGGWASFTAISVILGPMLGGILVDTVGWPSIFLINLPIGLLTLGLGVFGITESADPDHAAFDPAGQLLSVVFLGALTYALIGAGHAGWRAAPILAGLGIAAATLILFVVVESRMARPVFPVDLFRDRAFAALNVASFVLGFSGYSSLFLFSLFLQQAQGWSAAQAGWRMAPVFVAMSLVSSVSGRLSGRHGARPMILGYVLLGTSMLCMAFFSPTTSYAVIAPLFAVLGIGLGLAVPSTSAAAMAAARHERSGAASATINALRQSGMTIGVATLGTMMGAGAVLSLTRALSRANIPRAAELAAFAVSRHQMPNGLGMAPEVFQELLARAVADGFSAAVVCAGVVGLAAPVILIPVARRAAGIRRTSPNVSGASVVTVADERHDSDRRRG
jgi:MFS transporter, DHA2 family, methylenomycin A resistance protein